MIQTQLKLRLNTKDTATLEGWLWNLTGVWNWAVRKIELDAKGEIYYSPKDFQNLLANHGEKMGIPSHTLQGMLAMAHTAWKRCFQKIANKPRLKGKHNRLASIPFPDPFRAPKDGRVTIPGLGRTLVPQDGAGLRLGIGRVRSVELLTSGTLTPLVTR